MADTPGMDRLGDAMAAWLAFRREPHSTPAEFLAAHESLRDLLEPLLQEGGGEDEASDLGEFRFVAEIGRGGMGVVHEAVQRGLDRHVAVKLLLPGSMADARARARFRREAAITAQFAHPGIVAVHAIGEHEGRPWFAMELIDGVPLDRHAARVRAEQPTALVRTAVELIALAAEALHVAHEAGVVHRDVKPSNILVRRDGTPVVTDFGLARASGVPSLSQTGEFAGTPNYVSPEQARGAVDVDRRSDVFSLGVTLYELLTGELPFRGESSREVLDRIQRSEPRAPSRLDRGLPRDLDAVVMTALAKEPRHRYQDAAAFAADLRCLLARRPVRARRPGPLRRAAMWARSEPLRAMLAVTAAIAVAMAGTLIGNETALARGSAMLAADQVEDILLQATLAPMVGMSPAAKRDLLGQAAVLGRDDPATIAIIALALGSTQDGEVDGVALIDALTARRGMTPALRRVRQELLHRIDTNNPLDPLAAPQDSIDLYVCGVLAMRRWASGEKAAASEALDLLGRAVALTSRPRAAYFIAWNQAGRATGTTSVVRVAGDALAHHWPNSAASHLHRAMAWFDDDPGIAHDCVARSLLIAPDNFLGMLLSSDLAEADGDHAGAADWLRKAGTRYPERMSFLEQSHHHAGSDAQRAGR